MAFLKSGAAAFMCLLMLGAVGAVLIHAAGLRQRTYLLSVTWGNSGFLGVPVALAVFGEAGLGYAVAFQSVSLIFNSIIGQFIAVGRANTAAVIRSPIIYAIAAGLALPLSGMTAPAWLTDTTALISGMAIPLMLMMVGASMARLKLSAYGRALVFALLRTGLGAAIAFLVGTFLSLDPTAQAVLILQCAMPVAVLSYVMAQRWQSEPDKVAALVVVSTWSSAVSIPLILAFTITQP
jgi:predicted permease